MTNEFTTRPEIIFVSYNEIIKNPYPFILSQIVKRYTDFYKDFLDINKFKSLDNDNLLRLVIQRSEKNIFEYLAIKKFDYESSLQDIYNKFDDLFIYSPQLQIADSLTMLLSQKFTKKIYIHSDVYDKRIHLDIQTLFQDMHRVNYVTGDFTKVINKLEGVTTWILDDAYKIIPLVHNKKVEFTNILVANYGYNFALNDDKQLSFRINTEEWEKKYTFKFATFMPIKFSDNHFNMIKK